MGLGTLACEPVPGAPPASGVRPWGEVSSWAYWLDGPDETQLAGSPYELLVVDELDAGAVGRLRSGPCRPRLVAYLSVGEAEDYRWYWQEGWRQGSPAWLLGENPQWEGNHLVRFWDPQWQALVLESADRLVDLGYDGLYLDRVDAGLDDHRDHMAWLVRAVAARARERSPLGEDFGIFVQNAEELAASPDVAHVLTGLGREELYVAATDRPVGVGERRWAEHVVDLVRRSSRHGLVLTVDYATDPALAADAEAVARHKGYIPYVTTVELDRLGDRPVTACD